LPFIVTATTIGQQIGVVSKPTGASLLAAGLLSVIVFPATGLALLRQAAGPGAIPSRAPSAGNALVAVEDRGLCRLAAEGGERQQAAQASTAS
jgi:hypothetical protein